MPDDNDPFKCPSCDWSGDWGEVDMAEDSDGDASGFHCPSCGEQILEWDPD